ncbi:sucrase ferredoxin [Mesobaculum littorinae]|uniref:Sucrase ferredoxin n=1 Tax=Mesobaculum littorinae TaxID=2486419 RepID=A0A438ADK6_9RHOB|nr:sucrase ferredoxin [Mesobaculum littorinae]RVV96774.1 sucrase ferredoxin [Mesobaculum littorinae]
MTTPAPRPSPRPARRFCAEDSRAAGEPIAGTGMHPARNVLIQWPKGRWRHSMRIADGMEGEIERAITQLVEAGWRVNLIDRKEARADRLQVFVFPENLCLALPPETLPACLDALRGGGDPTAFGARPVARPVVACCTHGKHDRCCAKWGFAVYKALAAEAAARGDFDVWEATHLGGCRLAAGVLVLPAMHKYGRLVPADAAALLAAEAGGQPLLSRYRGACHLDRPAQTAEVAGRVALDRAGHRGPAEVAQTDADHWSVTVAGATARVRLHPDEVRIATTCAKMPESGLPDPRTILRAEVLELAALPETAGPGASVPLATHTADAADAPPAPAPFAAPDR